MRNDLPRFLFNICSHHSKYLRNFIKSVATSKICHKHTLYFVYFFSVFFFFDSLSPKKMITRRDIILFKILFPMKNFRSNKLSMWIALL